MRHVWEVIAVADDRALGSQQNKKCKNGTEGSIHE